MTIGFFEKTTELLPQVNEWWACHMVEYPESERPITSHVVPMLTRTQDNDYQPEEITPDWFQHYPGSFGTWYGFIWYFNVAAVPQWRIYHERIVNADGTIQKGDNYTVLMNFDPLRKSADILPISQYNVMTAFNKIIKVEGEKVSIGPFMVNGKNLNVDSFVTLNSQREPEYFYVEAFSANHNQLRKYRIKLEDAGPST